MATSNARYRAAAGGTGPALLLAWGLAFVPGAGPAVGQVRGQLPGLGPSTTVCGDPAGPTATGWVRGPEGAPLPRARVAAPGDRCAATTDSAGRFRLEAIPRSPDGTVTLRVAAAFHRARAVEIHPGSGGEALLYVTLEAAPRRQVVTDDRTALAERPAALDDPVGRSGCYWLGAAGAEGARVFRLRPGGTVTPPYFGSGETRWSASADSTVLRLTPVPGPGLGGVRSVRIHLGEDPAWSSLLLEVWSGSDAAVGTDFVRRTFAVRVPCGPAPAPASPVSPSARPGTPPARPPRSGPAPVRPGSGPG